MRLATIRVDGGTRAVRLDGDSYVEVGPSDLADLLADPDWRTIAESATGAVHDRSQVSLAPLVGDPGKVVCVGLNYRPHILEMGRPLPEYPTLFAKYSDTLIGATDAIALPPESPEVDWEAELVIVIGSPVRRASRAQAEQAIAGFTVMNDISMRDWQFRTREWLQGKNFEASTPVGPILVTPDELPGGTRPELQIGARVNGEVMQQANTGDLLFDPVDLVCYISTMSTLRPGDLIATGTPGGVGHARKPPRYLADGDQVVVSVEHIGELSNSVQAEG